MIMALNVNELAVPLLKELWAGRWYVAKCLFTRKEKILRRKIVSAWRVACYLSTYPTHIVDTRLQLLNSSTDEDDRNWAHIK